MFNAPPTTWLSPGDKRCRSPGDCSGTGEPRTQALGRGRRSTGIRITTPPLYLLLIIATAVTLGVTACSSDPGGVAQPASTHPARFLNAPITGFGGYHASGSVTDLSADWLVPQITRELTDAHASTWIGAQDPEGDFIQIGTTEDESFGMTRYSAFWSDPVVGFHPQFILSVSSGDEMSAHLAKVTDGWSGTIEDMTTGQTSRVPPSTHYAEGSAMQRSEWVQEDPATQGGTVDEPYPNMTQVTFTALEVDDKAPTPTFNDATALASPNGVVLVPSVVRNDSFGLEQGTAPQGQYLRGISAVDSAISRFVDPRIIGGGATAAHGKALVTAIVTFNSHLSTQQWPTGSLADVRKLVAHNRVLLNDLYRWDAAGESNLRLARFSADARHNPQFSNPIRSDLGLPPI